MSYIFLRFNEVLEIYDKLMGESGSKGLRDLGNLKSALAQPRMSFGGLELYSTLVEKAAALGYSLILNHPFIDGNKRMGHILMELLLRFNGYEIIADVDQQEQIILGVAQGSVSREDFSHWLQQHVVKN